MYDYSIFIITFILVTAKLSVEFRQFFSRFFFILALVVAANAVINLYEYLVLKPDWTSISVDRFIPMYGRAPDHYPVTGCLAYAIVFVSTFQLFLQESRVLYKILLSLCALILFVAMILTQSRGPVGAALIALFLVAVWGTRSFIIQIIGAFTAVALAFCWIPELIENAIMRGFSNRVEIWTKFIKLSIDQPIFGYGERILTLVELNNGERLGHAHNIIISAWFRGGLLAIGSLLSIIVVGLQVTFHFARNTKNGIPLGLFLTMLFAGLFDYELLVFLTDWQWVCFWLPIGLAIGCEVEYNSQCLDPHIVN